MRSAGPITFLRAMAVAAAVLLVPAPAAAAAVPEPTPAAASTEVTISPVDLDGPAVEAVKVTVKNAGPDQMRSLKVSFAGPVGWAVQPAVRSVDG